MTIVLGIDTDNYDGDISVARFQHLYSLGVRFNIIGLEAGEPYAKAQWQNSVAGGLNVPFAYKFLYWRDDDLDRMKQAAQFGLPIAIDVEYENGMAGGLAATVQRIADARQILIDAGVYWGIYSSQSEWQRLTGNSQAFAGDKCWTANYPYKAIPPVGYLPDFNSFPAFGGMVGKVWQFSDQCYDEPTFDMNAMEEYGPVNLNADGSQRLVSEGEYIVLYNQNIPIKRWGGETPGQEQKDFGGVWYTVTHGESTDGGHTSPMLYSDKPGD